MRFVVRFLLSCGKECFNRGREGVLLLPLTPGVANWDITSGSDTGPGYSGLEPKIWVVG